MLQRKIETVKNKQRTPGGRKIISFPDADGSGYEGAMAAGLAGLRADFDKIQ